MFPDDVSSLNMLKQQLNAANQREQVLLQQQQQHEQEFGQKRAMFKELFMQKEGK